MKWVNQNATARWDDKVKTSDKNKTFEVFFPKDCDLDKINHVIIRGREFVEVVRCKDCKWWDKVDNIDGVNYGTCERKCTAIRKDAFPNENWFCADGERRDPCSSQDS